MLRREAKVAEQKAQHDANPRDDADWFALNRASELHEWSPRGHRVAAKHTSSSPSVLVRGSGRSRSVSSIGKFLT